MDTRVGIFGLGYVGLTTAACLLRKHIAVIGYEVSQVKRDELLSGRCPLNEPGVAEIVLKGIAEKRFLIAASAAAESIPDIFFVTVGTPGDDRGATNLAAVSAVFAELNTLRPVLSRANAEIIVRSTIPPGTLNAFAKRHAELFACVPVAFYPEFLREGTAITDFEHPPQTILGIVKGGLAPKTALQLLSQFGFKCEVVDVISAESLKFACNAFHALKVCFANEVARMVSSFEGDANEVMELFACDTHLNISRKYLLPGAPYGGSCLPKDTRSIRNLSDCHGLNLVTIVTCGESNEAHFNFIVARILSHKPKRLAMLGLAFKRDTDDIRESPTAEMLYRLAARGGIELRVHDFLVRPETTLGVNQRLLERLIALPTIVFGNEMGPICSGADLVVVMHPDERYENYVAGLQVPVLNVARWRGF